MILSFLSLQDFEIQKSEIVKQEFLKYEVYVLEHETMRKLMKAFITLELSSCNMSNYPKQFFEVFNEKYDTTG